MSEAAFKQQVKYSIELYESLNRHFAGRVRQMIEDYGEVAAISRLVTSPNLQQGFKVLRDHGHLDKTFEAVGVRFKCLFRPDVIEAAQWRLDHPYDLL